MTSARQTSKIIKQCGRRTTSSISYRQKCTQPGKQAAETVALHLVTEELQHHFYYEAVVGQLAQVGYCNGCVQGIQRKQIKKRMREKRGS